MKLHASQHAGQPQRPLDLGIIRRLFGYTRPYAGRAILAMIALLLSTAATIGGPLVAKQAIDEGIVPGDESSLQMWVIVFLIVAGIGWAASAAQSYLTSWVGERILTDLPDGLGELAVIDGAGHYPHTETPAALLALLLPFLARTLPVAGPVA